MTPPVQSVVPAELPGLVYLTAKNGVKIPLIRHGAGHDSHTIRDCCIQQRPDSSGSLLEIDRERSNKKGGKGGRVQGAGFKIIAVIGFVDVLVLRSIVTRKEPRMQRINFRLRIRLVGVHVYRDGF